MTDEPMPGDEELEQGGSEAAAEEAPTGATPNETERLVAAADGDGGDVGGALTSNDYTVAFSPRQVAVGLAIVAGLVALAASRRRRRAHREDG